MKRVFLSILLLAAWALAAQAQAIVVTLQEADGSPKISAVTKIVVPNNTLTRSGSTGTLNFNASGNFTESVIITNNGSACLAIGPNGNTNPVLRVVCNVPSQATGLSITGNAAGAGVTLTALSTGTDESIALVPKGTGQVLGPSGSLSAPGFAFSASTGSGLYRVSASEIAIAVAGGQIARFTTSAIMTGQANIDIRNNSGEFRAGSTPDTGWLRTAAGIWRATNASTGAGNVIIGTSGGAIGTSGAGVLAFTLSTAPSTSPTDTIQVYSNDAAAADHNLYTRNEAGEINRLTGLAARNAAQFDKTSSTTFSTVTGLTRNAEANRIYALRAVLQTTANVAGGIKFQVGGTATATAISYEGVLMDTATVVAQTRATALATTVCALTTSTVGTCRIEGVIQVSGAGTITIDFAQNASSASASSVLANQYFQLIPIG